MFKNKDQQKKKETLLDFADSLKQEASLERKFEALWSLLKEKLELTDEDLAKHLNKTSSNKTKQTQASKDICNKCGRPVSVRSGICAYCGADPETVQEAIKKFT